MTAVSHEEFVSWLDKCDRVRYARVSKSLARDDQIMKCLPSNYQFIVSTDVYAIVAGADVAGWTLEKYVMPRLSFGLITSEELEAVKVSVYHNISRDSFFGLNTVFRKEGSDTKRPAETEEERHPLVKVFEHVTYLDYDLNVCERAFAAFNNGSGREDPRYFARRLRSLSVGDVVVIDCKLGRVPFSCEPVGFKPRTSDEMRIKADYDPVAVFGEAIVTVPWKGDK
jgi:hypothetical protein